MSTQPQHTPAPWHLRTHSDFIEYLVIDNGKGNSACVTILEYFEDDATDPEMLANARLIAQAPAMYEALTAILENLDRGEFVITNTTTGEPGNLDHLRQILKDIES